MIEKGIKIYIYDGTHKIDQPNGHRVNKSLIIVFAQLKMGK